MNANCHTFELEDVYFDVVRRPIKNVYLRVCPPEGRVMISAPMRMSLESIRLFGTSKLGWIRKQRLALENKRVEFPKKYIDQESHDYLGKSYSLKIIEQNRAQKVVLNPDTLELYMRRGASVIQRKALLQGWYRQRLRELAKPYILKLEKEMNVRVNEVRVRAMKTRWGTCHIRAKRIWLNTELAKKPIEMIEYIIIHEMVHLLERSHNEKFKAYMSRFLPQWKHRRKELNQLSRGSTE